MLPGVKKFFNLFLFGGLVLSLCCLLISLVGLIMTPGKNLPDPAKGPLQEEFDPSYIRLDNMEKLEAFCDSFYKAKAPVRTYPGIVSEVIRKRFYHGYSAYSFFTNPTINIAARILNKRVNAIVIPNDILKFSNAACSQQSIVGMELFQNKGYQVRQVGMFDSVSNSGHFAYEVYYDSGWHFFDVDEEPSTDVLRAYNRPSVAFLAKHPEIVTAAYGRKPSPQKFVRLITNNKTGKVDRFPAPNAYFLQVATKIFNYFGFLFFGGLILVRRRLNRKAKYPVAVLSKKSESRVPSISPGLRETAMKG